MQLAARARVFGDNINTDYVIASTRKRDTLDGAVLKRYLLEAVDPAFAATVQPGDVLVAGRNFGCGSSREHAVWAIQQAGYKAVIAPSFGDIFYSNATKNGLLPIVLPEEDVKLLMNAEGCQVDLEAQLVSFGGRVVHFDIDLEIKHRLLNGLDDIGLTLQQAGDIDAYEASKAWPAPATTSI